jgi:hypothetical protein
MKIEAERNPIRNCEFKLKCPKEWESLKTNDSLENKRFCEVCQNVVYYVQNEEELAFRVWRNHCIAIPAELGRKIFEKEIIKSASKPLMGHVVFKK